MNNSPRFEALIELAGKNEVLADIGCDHGIVSTFLAKNKLAKKVIACDVSAPSLEKAKKLAQKMGLNNIEFLLGDGFCALSQKPDTAIIAGMGADVIVNMLSHPFAKTHLVLQPMKDAEILIEELYKLGFYIDREIVVKHDRRFYQIFSAYYGKGKPYSIENLEKTDIAKEFLEHKKKILLRAKIGAESSKKEDAIKKANEIQVQINKIDGVLKNAYS